MGERRMERETGAGEKKRQWIVARQVSCCNPLLFFNPVTSDNVGKKKIERETGWERERKI